MTPQEAKRVYEALVRARKFDEKVVEMYSEQEMKCPVHLSLGQEGAPAGVCALLSKNDVMFSTHRCHAHSVAKGASFKVLLAELYGKKTGCSGGKGGSMHFVDPECGHMGSSAIVGGSLPLSLGAALAFKLRRKKNVAIAFFGDGATEQGTFHEGLHFASLKKLPIVFVCENNGLATIIKINERQVNPELYTYAAAYKMPSVRVNGNRPEEVVAAAREAIARAMKGDGPSFIEVMCNRWHEHVGPRDDSQTGVRTVEELAAMKKDCPVKNFRQYAEKEKLLSVLIMDKIDARVDAELVDAVAYAQKSPFPKASELYLHV